MKGYLIDTHIIAHSAPNKPHSPKLLAWLEAHTHELYLSVITLAEIENGISKLHRQGATNRAKQLEQ
jgi:toxin FitB